MIKDNSAVFNSLYIEKPKGKIRIFVYSLKKNALAILFTAFAICLVCFSKTNLIAAKNGLVLWATAVVPSLFPFLVANEMLSYTNVVHLLGKFLNPIMRPLFGVPGEGAFAFIMGLISGYPVGAKIVSNFMEEGICTKEEAERMLAFTNNSGPLFIIGTVGITLFQSASIGVLLFITHVLACISVGIVLNFMSSKRNIRNKFAIRIKNVNKCETKKINYLKNDNDKFQNNNIVSSNMKNVSLNNSKASSFSSLGEILGKSITSAISTILMIGGFVVIFSVIISILNQSHIFEGLSFVVSPLLNLIGVQSEFCVPFLSGLVELTNGVSLVANITVNSNITNIVLCAFLLGFGGISILLQVFSIACQCGLTIKKYAFGKLLQGIFAAIYTLIALQFFVV